MTNNLLQFSRFQMGRFDFNPSKLNLKRLINNNLNLLKGNIIKKQLNMSIEIDDNIDVFADEDMLNSIVQNLISNELSLLIEAEILKLKTGFFPFLKNPTRLK